jgi:integrase
MNKNLKVIASLAEIDKLIGTHTGRRTFCTIQYNAKIPIQQIMKISSHKTEREFYKYIGVDEKENAELFRNAQSEKYAIDTKGLLKPKMRIA